MKEDAFEVIQLAGNTSGCTDTTATNYDPSATIDDGSCVYSCAITVNSIFNLPSSASACDGFIFLTPNIVKTPYFL